jgi:hypothetical protein
VFPGSVPSQLLRLPAPARGGNPRLSARLGAQSRETRRVPGRNVGRTSRMATYCPVPRRVSGRPSARGSERSRRRELAMMGRNWDGFGLMWLWGLLMLVGIAVLVLLAVRLFTGGTSRGVPDREGPDPTAPRPTGRHPTVRARHGQDRVPRLQRPLCLPLPHPGPRGPGHDGSDRGPLTAIPLVRHTPRGYGELIPNKR